MIIVWNYGDADQSGQGAGRVWNWSGSATTPAGGKTVCGAFSVAPRVDATPSVAPRVDATPSVEEC